jgi:hypothetical protein
MPRHCFVALFFAAACTGHDAIPGPHPPPVTGQWNGAIVSGQIAMSLVQSGVTLLGNGELVGGTVPTGCLAVTITGSRSDNLVAAVLHATVSDSAVFNGSTAGDSSILGKLTGFGFAASSVTLALGPPPPALAVSPPAVAIKQLDSLQLTTTVRDSTGAPVPGAVVTYVSEQPTLLGVSATGHVKSLGPSGNGTIRVAAGLACTRISASVIRIAKSIIGLPTAITLGEGGYFPVHAEVLDAIGVPIQGGTIAFTGTPGTLDFVSGTLLHSTGPLGAADLVASYADSASTVVDTVPVSVQQFAAPTGTVVDTVPSKGIWPTAVATFAVAVSSRGRVYATAEGSNAPLLGFDLPARSFASATPVGQALSVVFDSSGATAFLGTTPASIVDAHTNNVLAQITTVLDPYVVGVSPDAQKVYIGGNYTEIYVANAVTKVVVDSIFVPGLPNHLVFHPTAHLLYANLDNSQVVEIDTDSNRVVRSFHTGSLNAGIAIAPDGSELYNVTNDNVLWVVNLTTGSTVGFPGLGGDDVAATPDGSRLIVAAGPSIRVVNRVSRTLVDSLVVGGSARRVALSHDGGIAVVSNEAGWVNIIF